jgi:hypothetical protein
MGWGQGIGIGWPNASASAGPPAPTYVYFVIQGICGGGIMLPGTTQAILAGIYSSGDYVYSETVGQRVLLGAIVNEPGDNIYNVTGQIYPDCEE